MGRPPDATPHWLEGVRGLGGPSPAGMRREEREPLIDRGPPSANGACPQRAAGLAGTRSWVGECDVETRASVRRSCQARGQMIRRAGFLRPRRAGAMDWTGDDAPCQTCRLCHGHRRGRGRPRGVVGSPFCGVSDVLAALARSSLDPHWVTPLRVNGKVAQLFANRLAGRRESPQATSTAPGPGRREAQAARPPQLKPPGQAAAARASSSSSSSSSFFHRSRLAPRGHGQHHGFGPAVAVVGT
jgi:hypothetical protein